MQLSHIFLAVLVTIIWGVNFIFVKMGLGQMTPFMLCTARFILVCIPFIFFIKRPAIPFQWIALYGLTMFALQFFLLFMGIRAGMSPGLASLIMQVQIFFSMFFAASLWKELPTVWQIIGALVSFTGIGLVAIHLDNNITLLGFIYVLAAAAAWGMGNVITKAIGKVNTVSLVVWGSFIAGIPMLVLTLYFDGLHSIVVSYQHLDWRGISAVLFIVYVSTWVGYVAWSWLLGRYSVGMVVPFTLLVPIFGLLSSIMVLHEEFQLWKICAGILVMGGLCVNLIGSRYALKNAK